MSSNMTTTSSVFPLFRLPLELREQIYENVLQQYVTKNEEASLSCPQFRYSTFIYTRMLRPIGLYYHGEARDRKVAAALLYVSQGVNQEARKVLLERFRFAMFPIFYAITPEHLSQSIWIRDFSNIRNLEFVCPFKSDMTKWTMACGFMLLAFPNLRNVLVTIVHYVWPRVGLLQTMLDMATPFASVETLRIRARNALELDTITLDQNDSNREWSVAELEKRIAWLVSRGL